MSDALEGIDPEVVELLREAMRAGDSAIFRGGPAAPGEADGDALTPWTPGLALAERHLIAVHRAETALLLREAFTLSFLDDPRAAASFAPAAELPDPGEWVGRARHQLGSDLEDGGDPEARELLESGVEWGPRAGPSPEILARAALRVEPCDKARIYQAELAVMRGRLDEARDWLGAVLGGLPCDLHRWIAWKNLGFSYLEEGQLGLALDAYERAAGIEGSDADSLFYAFVLALRSGQEARARDLAAAIEERIPEGDPSVESFVDQVSGDGPGGKAVIGPLPSGTWDRFGPDVERIAHVF